MEIDEITEIVSGVRKEYEGASELKLNHMIAVKMHAIIDNMQQKQKADIMRCVKSIEEVLNLL